MQTATSETESKSLDLSICVHHYTLRAPCPKGQGIDTAENAHYELVVDWCQTDMLKKFPVCWLSRSVCSQQPIALSFPRHHRQNNGHPELEGIPFRPLLRHGA